MSDLDAEIIAGEKRMSELDGERKRIEGEIALLSHKLWVLRNNRQNARARAYWEARPIPVWASEPPPGEWRVFGVWPKTILLTNGPSSRVFDYSRRTGYALRKRSGPRLDVEATLAAWKAWRPHG